MQHAIAINTDFVPLALDATTYDNIEPFIRLLLTRPVTNSSELERWLIDRGELESACSEAKANLYISMTCDTENAEVREAYLSFVQNVQPKLTPAFFDLDRRYVELASTIPLNQARYNVIDRRTKTDVAMFRAENIPLETQLSQLGQRFEQLAGSLLVDFEGKQQTLPMMARYQEETDRARRESAWRAVAERRFREVEPINTLYDEMIVLRDQLARNASCADFVEFSFKNMHRFDYTPQDCMKFHDSIELAVMPIVRRLERRRATTMGLDRLRPWDMAVDAKGAAPLRPFVNGVDLMSKSIATCRRLDGRLGDMLAELGDGSNALGAASGACLDLDTRKGKAPGGYQYNRDRSRRPFIFMNSAGMQGDVETLVHEAGHAFHSMLCRPEPLMAYRTSPIEFAEVASMSMELLTMPHWGRSGPKGTQFGPCFFDNEEDFARARRQKIKSTVTLLPWVATIDAFQHWVYSNPNHTQSDRTAAWLELDRRFGSSADWTGLEKYKPFLWQRQIHLFGHPMYYVEYGIAQLGALQLWLVSLEQGESTAVDRYIQALSLGGSKPLPALFEAAGLTFDFGYDTVARLAERVERELDAIPE